MSAPTLSGRDASESTTVMAGLLTELRSVTDTAGRADLSRRLTAARERIGDARLRIVVTGESRKGLSSVADALVAADVCRAGRPTREPTVIEHGERVTRSAGPDGVVAAAPSDLLADGVVLIDTPGVTGSESRGAAATLALLPTADAVLFVTDAAREFTAAEIRYLQQIRQVCPLVACVINKIDTYPRWADIQKADRKHLTDAGLDLPILPVSAHLHRTGVQLDDPGLIIESGVPQLTGFIRDHLLARTDAVARESVLHDVRVVSDQVALVLNSELASIQDPRHGAAVLAELEQARGAAAALHARTANWQYVLGDGITELNVAVEHDLRNRLRALIRESEQDIAKSDPARRWDEFRSRLDERIETEVSENFVLAQRLSVELTEKVALRFAEEERYAAPRLRIDGTAGVLSGYGNLEPLDSSKNGVAQRAVSALRGSYSGVLMIGVATTLAGLALVNPWSIAAGALLGAHTVWEDRKSLKSRRRAEAKIAVARLLDEVSFQVGTQSKQRLREVQRTLRDHFTEVADQRLRSADEAIAAAGRAVDRHDADRRDRVATIHSDLQRLQGIRSRTAALFEVEG